MNNRQELINRLLDLAAWNTREAANLWNNASGSPSMPELAEVYLECSKAMADAANELNMIRYTSTVGKEVW